MAGTHWQMKLAGPIHILYRVKAGAPLYTNCPRIDRFQPLRATFERKVDDPIVSESVGVVGREPKAGTPMFAARREEVSPCQAYVVHSLVQAQNGTDRERATLKRAV